MEPTSKESESEQSPSTTGPEFSLTSLCTGRSQDDSLHVTLTFKISQEDLDSVDNSYLQLLITSLSRLTTGRLNYEWFVAWLGMLTSERSFPTSPETFIAKWLQDSMAKTSRRNRESVRKRLSLDSLMVEKPTL